ncbi:DEAD/DEAH box helicase [Pleionea sp. CnH1-48]|uniref:DEAD/DEAH box helicase n=1 Tax=Pleionea sp. CnH1-48 TaxID=2954494 RepID=UPI00209771C1|nr:DEAD/DEAH box helicase [Pleionea sp. CnH1-48]MCO7223109.1 DEAD/DEAH box helicase [Pleionea sp. CnH1-48]
MSETESMISFRDLSLGDKLLQALDRVGYETPSPIQAQSIPLVMAGHDMIGQAQTGTGKTASFALPILSRIDVTQNSPQALVIAPTRELALQVAEAFNEYARFMPGFRVLPVYGGQPFTTQIRQIKRGPHVIVGTPGRIMDHMRRGNLIWDDLKQLVLDEADEMLRMGFIDDVEWILERTPSTRQVILFSATMPKPVKRVAETFLKEPKYVKIESKNTTAQTIQQRFCMVNGNNKLDALTRILEAEEFDAMIIFVRTKGSTQELSDKLVARGFACDAIHGDIAQNQREKVVQKLKDGKLDILIATDVAARGLDVERISHVVNYDIPYDPESYVHRIGRTGRAGRSGDAILFVTPRERRLLRTIEQTTRKTIERMNLPSVEVINDKRVNRLFTKVSETLSSDSLKTYLEILERYQSEHEVTGIEIAAALASIMYAEEPLLMNEIKEPYVDERRGDRDRKRRPAEKVSISKRARPLKDQPDVEMERYVLAVGRDNGATPTHIVGAIANEAEIESKYIGFIRLYDDLTTVDLPKGMPEETLKVLRKARVCGRPLNIQSAADKDFEAMDSGGGPSGGGRGKKPRGGGRGNDNNRSRPRRKSGGYKNSGR